MAILGNFSLFFYYSSHEAVQTHFKVHMDLVENGGKGVIDA